MTFSIAFVLAIVSHNLLHSSKQQVRSCFPCEELGSASIVSVVLESDFIYLYNS